MVSLHSLVYVYHQGVYFVVTRPRVHPAPRHLMHQAWWPFAACPDKALPATMHVQTILDSTIAQRLARVSVSLRISHTSHHHTKPQYCGRADARSVCYTCRETNWSMLAFCTTTLKAGLHIFTEHLGARSIAWLARAKYSTRSTLLLWQQKQPGTCLRVQLRVGILDTLKSAYALGNCRTVHWQTTTNCCTNLIAQCSHYKRMTKCLFQYWQMSRCSTRNQGLCMSIHKQSSMICNTWCSYLTKRLLAGRCPRQLLNCNTQMFLPWCAVTHYWYICRALEHWTAQLLCCSLCSMDMSFWKPLRMLVSHKVAPLSCQRLYTWLFRKTFVKSNSTVVSRSYTDCIKLNL